MTVAASDVPLWLTLVTALGSGAAGAGITALLQGRQARQERWRERVIAAALAFQEPLVDGHGQYTLAYQHAREGRTPELHWNLAVERINDARRKEAGLLLLLGSHSPTVAAAVRAIAACDAVNAAMLDPQPGLPEVKEALEGATRRVLAFADDANREIWGRPRRRQGETLREYFDREAVARASGDGP